MSCTVVEVPAGGEEECGGKVGLIRKCSRHVATNSFRNRLPMLSRGLEECRHGHQAHIPKHAAKHNNLQYCYSVVQAPRATKSCPRSPAHPPRPLKPSHLPPPQSQLRHPHLPRSSALPAPPPLRCSGEAAEEGRVGSPKKEFCRRGTALSVTYIWHTRSDVDTEVA